MDRLKSEAQKSRVVQTRLTYYALRKEYMNHLIQASMSRDVVTMSSRDIAELVESRHDSVKRAMDTLAEKGLIAFTQSVEPTPRGGKPTTVYMVGKRDSYVVVAQLSPEFTARLVDRWQELESRSNVTLPDFTNPAVAARAWADQVEAAQIAQQALALAAPKVAFVDKYVDATGLKGFRQVAKLLKANETRFREFMVDHKIMYRLGGEWMAYQNHIDAGRFDVKAGSSDTGHAFNQTKFTPKGVNWIAGLWAQSNLQEAA